MPSAVPSISNGFTRIASPSSAAAPCELAEHQHAVVVDARRDELLGDEVHAVADRRSRA